MGWCIGESPGDRNLTLRRLLCQLRLLGTKRLAALNITSSSFLGRCCALLLMAWSNRQKATIHWRGCVSRLFHFGAQHGRVWPPWKKFILVEQKQT
jgi:hypothetical protein